MGEGEGGENQSRNQISPCEGDGGDGITAGDQGQHRRGNAANSAAQLRQAGRETTLCEKSEATLKMAHSRECVAALVRNVLRFFFRWHTTHTERDREGQLFRLIWCRGCRASLSAEKWPGRKIDRCKI